MSRSYEGKEIARLEGLHVKRTGPCGVVRTPQALVKRKQWRTSSLQGEGESLSFQHFFPASAYTFAQKRHVIGPASLKGTANQPPGFPAHVWLSHILRPEGI